MSTAGSKVLGIDLGTTNSCMAVMEGGEPTVRVIESEGVDIHYFSVIYEVIDTYSPDYIWFDFGLDFLPEGYVKDFLAYYYNHAQAMGNEVVITYKWHNLAPMAGVIDLILAAERPVLYAGGGIIAAGANAASPHHEAGERVIGPDATILLHYMLARFTNVVKKVRLSSTLPTRIAPIEFSSSKTITYGSTTSGRDPRTSR